MGEKCSECGGDINDNTQDCPKCGHRTREERLAAQLAIADSAIEGWRDRVESMRRFACGACQDGGPCDDCPCHVITE